jgi:hypothetical protein
MKKEGILKPVDMGSIKALININANTGDYTWHRRYEMLDHCTTTTLHNNTL